jgi:hypothetical protein|uniref:Uncharacterized protein n=1 Tax=Populus trichocarpa TaxID=3694 RepID=A0A3N7EMP9_POPTR
MSTKSDSTSVSMDRKWCNILEVMTELHFIEEVTIGDEFHGFAIEYLSLRRMREMWASIGDLEKKLKWIQRMYERINLFRSRGTSCFLMHDVIF